MLSMNILIRGLPPQHDLTLIDSYRLDDYTINTYECVGLENLKQFFYEFKILGITWRWCQLGVLTAATMFPIINFVEELRTEVVNFIHEAVTAETLYNQPFIYNLTMFGDTYVPPMASNAIEIYEQQQRDKVMGGVSMEDDVTPEFSVFGQIATISYFDDNEEIIELDDIPDAFKNWGEEDDV